MNTYISVPPISHCPQKSMSFRSTACLRCDCSSTGSSQTCAADFSQWTCPCIHQSRVFPSTWCIRLSFEWPQQQSTNCAHLSVYWTKVRFVSAPCPSHSSIPGLPNTSTVTYQTSLTTIFPYWKSFSRYRSSLTSSTTGSSKLFAVRMLSATLSAIERSSSDINTSL